MKYHLGEGTVVTISDEEFVERSDKFIETLDEREIVLFPILLEKMEIGEPLSSPQMYALLRKFEKQVFRIPPLDH
jgi:hypothetical protein